MAKTMTVLNQNTPRFCFSFFAKPLILGNVCGGCIFHQLSLIGCSGLPSTSPFVFLVTSVSFPVPVAVWSAVGQSLPQHHPGLASSVSLISNHPLLVLFTSFLPSPSSLSLSLSLSAFSLYYPPETLTSLSSHSVMPSGPGASMCVCVLVQERESPTLAGSDRHTPIIIAMTQLLHRTLISLL